MGSCTSCCVRQRRRRRRKAHDPEREPLIRDAERTGKSLADVLGALRAGKLPSQSQLDRFIQQALRSRQLNDTRHMSERGTMIVQETKLVLQYLLEFGLEKNHDDIIQDLMYSFTQLDPKEAVATGENVMQRVGEQTHEVAQDAQAVMVSFGTLLKLAFTSAAFRLGASSVVLLVRDAIVTTMHQVEEVASTVESSAGTVEHLAAGVGKAAEDVEGAVQDDRIVDMDVRDTAKAVVQDVKVGLEQNKSLPSKPTQEASQHEPSVEDVVVTQLQEILKEAQSDPQCLSALLTILGAFQKAAKPWRGPDHEIIDLPTGSSEDDSPMLGQLKTFIERMVPKSSLRTLYTSLAANQRDIRRYIRGLRNLLTKVIGDKGYISSTQARKDIHILAEEGRTLLNSLRGWREVVRALDADSTTHKLYASIFALVADVVDYVGKDTTPSFTQSASEAAHSTGGFAKDLWRDARGYFIPLVLKALWRVQDRGEGTGVPIPLPRVEFVSNTVKGAVDGRMMFAQAQSFASYEDEEEELGGRGEEDGRFVLPSTVHINRQEETVVDLRGAHTTSDTHSLTHLHLRDAFALDGEIRLNGIQYFAAYRNLYSDEGKLDLVLSSSSSSSFSSSTSPRGIDLELTLDDWSIRSAIVQIPSNITIRPEFISSKHSIINKLFIEPFTPVILRRVAERVLEGWIIALGDKVQEGRRTGDWWNALLGPPNPPDEPGMEVHASVGGIHVHPPNGESVIAVGAVPQVLPAHAIPEPPAIDEVVEHAREVVEDTAKDVGGRVKDAQSVAGNVQERYEERVVEEEEEGERGGSGWRSDAFDL